ncbi:Thiol reductase thioredoxin (modular protein) [Carnobacterium maltaromaticum]|uniref:thioredoxin family protein n=1 Tax=Carnobacterium maltaromaticum TaxID=2751 RepID=UPI00191BA96E|nr:thioredoxin family protein [Carnobacterium maltaromaticum]CAD5897033.1 Thiol reductase thioredoxin (modular protein) [Carnobacterium maltaromaticum]
MKKKEKILLMVVIFLVFMLGYQYKQNKDVKEKLIETEAYSPMYKYLSTVTLDSFEKKIKNNESFVVYIGRPSCSDCTFFEDDFIELLEKFQLNNKIYYMNVYWEHKNNLEGFIDFKKSYGFNQTPAFLVFSKGKKISQIEWSEKGLPKSILIEWFKQNKVIEGE